MVTNCARVATRLSWFLALLSIASCLRIDSTGSDSSHDPPPDAFVHGTSLDGPVTCGSMACPAGSLCTHWSAGIDAGLPDDGGVGGGGDYISCTSVPAACRVQDCSDFTQRCSACISDLCSSGSYGYGVSVTGRDLYCPGV